MDALKRAEKARQAKAEQANADGDQSTEGENQELSLDPMDPSQSMESKQLEAEIAAEVASAAHLDFDLEETESDSSALSSAQLSAASESDTPKPGAESPPGADDSSMSMSMDFGDLSLDDTSATLPSMKSAQRSVDDYFDGTHSMSMSMERVQSALEENQQTDANTADSLDGTRTSDTTTQERARAVFDAKVAPKRTGLLVGLVVVPLLLFAVIIGVGFVYWDPVMEMINGKPPLVASRTVQPVPNVETADTTEPQPQVQQATVQTESPSSTAADQATNDTVETAVAQADSSQPISGTLIAQGVETESQTAQTEAAQSSTTVDADNTPSMGDKLQAMADEALKDVMPTATVDLAAKLNEMEPSSTPSNAPVTFRVTRNSKTDRISKDLLHAYDAFQSGANERAMTAYRKVLKRRPQNRDALLGVAALEMRAGNFNQATEVYYRLLSANPRDGFVKSALISLREDVDPVAGESAIKSLLHKNPGTANLHFNLGNLFARQSRWPEAQQAYFDAYRLDVGNPDYAYNLAISLDHLSKRREAMQFYQLAVDLADAKPASFQRSDALQRIGMISAAQ